MSLPAAPPRYASWAEMTSSIRQGENSWRTFAVQKAINSVRFAIVDEPWARVEPDGDFGPGTLAAVKACQSQLNLTADGIVGPATQKKLLDVLGDRTHELVGAVPAGLMRGFSESEGANLLAATNWSVAGGVDCGCVQLRVLGPPYSAAELMGAFDPMDALMRAANDFAGRAAAYWDAPWIRRQGAKRQELAMRTAVMAHNWPVGAEAIAKNGICSSPNSPATWVPAGTKFPDGAPVKTRWEWCQFYAMGGVHGEGSITKYVRDWS